MNSEKVNGWAVIICASALLVACSHSSAAPSPDAPAIVPMGSVPPAQVALQPTAVAAPHDRTQLHVDSRSEDQKIRDACRNKKTGAWECPAINPQTLKYDPALGAKLTKAVQP